MMYSFILLSTGRGIGLFLFGLTERNKDDLISEGMLGLCQVANTFDESRGTKFCTYATLCIVFNELKYMGYNLYVYDNNGKEIDFLAQKGNKKYFIQVAYSVLDEKAYKREFGAFRDIDNLSQKIIITNDDIDYSTSSVRHIKLKDFLLMEEL